MTVQKRLASSAVGVLAMPWGATACLAQGFNGAGATGVVSETTFHLHGTVVDGMTGKPVPRALVTSQDRRLATLTNAEGGFSFEITFGGVVDGRMQTMGPFGAMRVSPSGTDLRMAFQLQKPGYLTPQGRLSASFEGTSADVQFKLMPAGTIAGHVSASGSDSPNNVMVALMAHNANNGERTWATNGMQHTDRNGGFRFTNLRPGEYTVMTTEWRGDEPVPTSRNAVTEQYPPVYFGDSATMAGATKLHLHYGESAQADLHLRPAKYYPVTVPVDGSSGGINVQVNDGEAASGYRLGYNQADHAVEGSLPAGTYTLRVVSQRPQQSFGVTVLHVGDGPVRTAPLALSPPASVTVRFHTAYTGKQAPAERGTAHVFLQPETQSGPFAQGMPQPGQDEVVVSDVEPGRYSVHVEPAYGYVASMQSAGTDLLTQPLVVSEGGTMAPIDVLLRDDSGRVSGTVHASDRPLPDAVFVSFLPSSPEAKFTTTEIGPDGTFSLENVVPGSYVVLASSGQAWQFPYRDPEALHAIAGKGVQVKVTPNGTQAIEVPLPDAAALELP